jgi:ubiquinone biosynthesis protein UbiJ
VEIKGTTRAGKVLRVALQQFELKLALFILATSFNFLKAAT